MMLRLTILLLLAQLGHFKKAGAEAKKVVREFRLKDGETVAEDFKLDVNIFSLAR